MAELKEKAPRIIWIRLQRSWEGGSKECGNENDDEYYTSVPKWQQLQLLELTGKAARRKRRIAARDGVYPRRTPPNRGADGKAARRAEEGRKQDWCRLERAKRNLRRNGEGRGGLKDADVSRMRIDEGEEMRVPDSKAIKKKSEEMKMEVNVNM